MKPRRKVNISEQIGWIVVSLFLFAFCFFIHPQVILDYDDWSYVSLLRPPIPSPTFWNPSRVLPELLMPLCGYLGALLFRLFPATGYIRAETLCFSLALSLTLFVYLRTFSSCLRKRLALGSGTIFLTVGFFFLLHFLIFRTQAQQNSWLFRTANLTCCFFYLIPALLNYSAVFLFLARPELTEPCIKENPLRTAGVLLLVYFCIFSNLFANIILAVYAALRILAEGRKTGPSIALLRKTRFFLLILFLWVLSILLEGLGGRAELTEHSVPFIQDFRETLRNAVSVLRSLSPVFVLLAVGMPMAAFLSEKNDRKSGMRISLRMILMNGEGLLFPALITVYTLLLCAKVDVSYIYRPEVLITVFGTLLAFVSAAFGTLVSRTAKGGLIGGILLLGIFFYTDLPGRTFAESYGIDAVITPETCMAVSQDVVDQVVEAEREGRTELTIDVSFNGDYCENWPQCVYLQEALIPTLLRHGVISQPIQADIFPSMEFNAKYALDFPLLRENTETALP